MYASYMFKDKYKVAGDINSLILLVYNEGYCSQLICNCIYNPEMDPTEIERTYIIRKQQARFN